LYERKSRTGILVRACPIAAETRLLWRDRVKD
jgi:hypothetical protein